MSPRVTVHCLGNEREPVAVIDNFAVDPALLRTAAARCDYEAAGEHYPGVKAPLPPSYLRDQRDLLTTVFRQVFGVDDRVQDVEARFSIVTTPGSALSLHQRLPHVDALVPGRLALIHYLVPGGTDGTSFYRHRATGFETVDAARAAAYFAALDVGIRARPVADGYVVGDTPLFEQIGGFDGSYNRALLYRGRLLHSGSITPGRALPADPLAGRLTVTGFFAAS